MLYRIFFFYASLLVASVADTPKDIITKQVPQARAIIEEWQKGDPTDITRTLHIVYWTPSDREPAPLYRERLTRVMESIQKFYSSEMNTLGFGKQTINLDIADDKLLKIHLVRAPHPYKHYHPNDGSKIRKECLPTLTKTGIDASKETILIFCNMSNWYPKQMRMTQNSPYYARGTHRNGTAWQVDSPLLDPVLLPKKEPIIRDGQYGKISVGKYNSIFVGGVAHELGHALGLPHNCERADERAAMGIALMGGGNRTYGRDLRNEGKGSFLTLASGLRLASHPMFTGSIKGIESRGQAELKNLTISKIDKGFTVRGQVVTPPSSPPVHAVLAYTDPEGGSNYDATTATAIPMKDGQFALHCTDLKATGRPASLRLIILYANGDATSHVGIRSPYTYPYFVHRDGQPDISDIELALRFSPFLRALQKRDGHAADAELQRIAQSQHNKASTIAKRLLHRKHAFPSPSKIDDKTKVIDLADTTPSSAKIGYGQPVYNRLPGHNPLIRSGRYIHTSGIYAHAPARHQYQLGGKWKKLTGSCGLGNNGTVVFVIKADGKQLWRSRLLKHGQTQHYDLDVTNKQHIELIVEDGGDGRGSDWGIWLEPTLKR